MKHRLLPLLAFVATTGLALAEVTRVDVISRTDVGTSGYEKIVGKLHFAVAPAHPRNRLIADLDLAPVNAAGRVEFSADLYILRPKHPATGNGTALVEVSNRGGKGLLTSFHRGAKSDPVTDADLGDAFLTRQGYTLVWVGWEFDVPPTPGLLRIELPVATDHGKPITGIVRARFVPDASAADYDFTDLAAYPPIDADGPDSTLAVCAAAGQPAGPALAREQWRLRGRKLTLDGGFAPGKTYEVSYRAANPPIAGLGFAAVRDTATWLKHDAQAVAPVARAYTFGISQGGRFLRDYLYHGFNTDERDRPVFDAVLAHIAGSARIDLNRRWSLPRTLGLFSATAYPFSDTAQPDPVSGETTGLLDNPRVTHAPKIFYTNTSVEYWGGGRVASLLHTNPAGTADAALPANVRHYFFAGTQHGPERTAPPPATKAQQRTNPTDYWWSMRALLLALDRWVTKTTEPPASAYPSFHAGTLTPVAAVKFPAIPGSRSPRTLNAGRRVANPLLPGGAGADAPLPLLVPQVDADGNDLGGIRLPDIAVPLATATGWNFRRPDTGEPGELAPLLGSWIPFPATQATRAETNDPRRAVEERYASRADYLAKFEGAARALVQQRYLLDEDVPALVRHAGESWDWVTPPR